MSSASNWAQRRTKPNYLYAISSVALVLFVLGFFSLLALQARQLIFLYKEQINLIVELKSTALPADITALRSHLRQAPYVRSGSLRFIGKTEAARMMKQEFGDAFSQLDLPNPFLDVLIFNVGAANLEPERLAAIRRELRSWGAVNDVFYQQNLLDTIAGNLQQAGLIALFLALIFTGIAISLIYNTIRLALYANRFLIKNMELVGASWGFISRPYVVRALLHGLLSGALAGLALTGLLYVIGRQIPSIGLLQNAQQLLPVLAGLLLGGMLLYTLSTALVVNKYLRMRADDLY